MTAALEIEQPEKVAKRRHKKKMSVEPVGIVISRGTREEPKPAFWSYEWSAPPSGRAAGAKPRAA